MCTFMASKQISVVFFSFSRVWFFPILEIVWFFRVGEFPFFGVVLFCFEFIWYLEFWMVCFLVFGFG